MKNAVDFSKYKNAQVVQFFAHFRDVLGMHNLDFLNSKPLIKEIEVQHNLLSDVLNETNASELTVKLEEQDSKRDNCYRGIKRLLDGFLLSYKPEIKDAAEQLLFVFNKNGEGVDRLPYSEETAVLTKLYKDLTETQELKDATKLLGIKDWVTELQVTNMDFQSLFVDRVQSSSTLISSRPEIRKALVLAYRNFARHIEAVDILTPSPELTELMSVVDSLIEKSNLNANRRGVTGQDDLDDLSEDVDETAA